MDTMFGEIIAYGIYTEPEGEPIIYSVFVFIKPEHRIPNQRNYLLGFLQGDTLTEITHYANIVDAAQHYAEDYGMDI